MKIDQFSSAITAELPRSMSGAPFQEGDVVTARIARILGEGKLQIELDGGKTLMAMVAPKLDLAAGERLLLQVGGQALGKIRMQLLARDGGAALAGVPETNMRSSAQLPTSTNVAAASGQTADADAVEALCRLLADTPGIGEALKNAAAALNTAEARGNTSAAGVGSQTGNKSMPASQTVNPNTTEDAQAAQRTAGNAGQSGASNYGGGETQASAPPLSAIAGAQPGNRAAPGAQPVNPGTAEGAQTPRQTAGQASVPPAEGGGTQTTAAADTQPANGTVQGMLPANPGTAGEAQAAQQSAGPLSSLPAGGGEPQKYVQVFSAANDSQAVNRTAPDSQPMNPCAQGEQPVQQSVHVPVSGDVSAEPAKGGFAALRETLVREIESLFVRPGAPDFDGESLKRRIESLNERLTELGEKAADAGPHAAALKDAAACLAAQNREAQQIPQFAYLQIPVTLREKETTAELYVFRRNRNKGPVDPDATVVMLVLDTEHMGRVESLVRAEDRNVQLKMRVQDESVARMLEGKAAVLDKALEETGYRLTRMACTVAESPVTPADAQETAIHLLKDGGRHLDVTI